MLDGASNRETPSVSDRSKKQPPAFDPDFGVKQFGDHSKTVNPAPVTKTDKKHGYEPGEDEEEYDKHNDDDPTNDCCHFDVNRSKMKDNGTSSTERRARILNRIQDEVRFEFNRVLEEKNDK